MLHPIFSLALHVFSYLLPGSTCYLVSTAGLYMLSPIYSLALHAASYRQSSSSCYLLFTTWLYMLPSIFSLALHVTSYLQPSSTCYLLSTAWFYMLPHNFSLVLKELPGDLPVILECHTLTMNTIVLQLSDTVADISMLQCSAQFRILIINAHFAYQCYSRIGLLSHSKIHFQH